MSAPARYVVGIDLGTSNCAVAYAPLDAVGAQGLKAVRSLELPQLVAPGEVEYQGTLASAIYLPAPDELRPEALTLPFGVCDEAIGAFARAQGTRAPARLVASAKSWLCHPSVDRRAAILPPGAPRDVTRMSPVEASARLLTHLRRAWDHAFEDAPLAEQEVVLAVPASFDAVARKLTVEAAGAAGLRERLTLIEEPQAAFYDFHAAGAEGLEGEQLVLVIDVGGGTTDLTLIQAGRAADGSPALERLAVGDHILLGGDNMDMTLARAAEQRMKVPGGRLDPVRWALLVRSCRAIKEAMLSTASADVSSWRVSVPGRGSRLIGGALTCELTRDEIDGLVVDGFFPDVSCDARPRRPVRTGLAQLGLPYEAEAAITRHVAAFLRRHGDARPDAILLNGGVFESPRLAARMVEVVRSWGAPARLLPHRSLDRAVARGAAVRGLVRRGVGARIGGGSARGYYVEVASVEATETRQGLCVIPRHQEVGVPVALSDRTFDLVIGRPVQFRVHATTSDRADVAGDVVTLVPEEFQELPPVQTLLPSQGGRAEIPITLRAVLSEVGALELACVAVDRDERWELEFDMRASGQRGGHSSARPEGLPPPRGLPRAARQKAADELHVIFGNAPRKVSPKEVRQLPKALQTALGSARETWELPVLRELWEMLMGGLKKRRRSPEHEAVFYNLAGYLLRPGFGYPQDEWRVQDLWPLHRHGIEYHREPRVWHAWWVMWRRVVGGLTAAQQEQLLTDVRPWVMPGEAPAKAKRVPEGAAEMLRLLASLERIGPVTKAEIGEWALSELERGRGGPTGSWVLARLGARVPFSGPVHNLVDPSIAEEWASRLLNVSWKKNPQAAYAAAHIARLTDDRLRDLDAATRARVGNRLQQAGHPGLARLVREVVVLEARDEGRFVGDALPVGLLLSG